jgi:hypothetical protein
LSLTPGFTSALDLFRKLQRDVARLNNEVTDDGFFNLVITGYSLIDWVKNDPSLPASARTKAAINSLHTEPWLRVCGDLANASKHFALTRRQPVSTQVTSKSGWNAGRFGKGLYGEGEREIEVHIKGAPVWTALEFATGLMQAWLQFFARHGIDVQAPVAGGKNE